MGPWVPTLRGLMLCQLASGWVKQSYAMQKNQAKYPSWLSRGNKKLAVLPRVLQCLVWWQLP